jgi:hypothetical protein
LSCLQNNIHLCLFFDSWPSFKDCDQHNHSVTKRFKITTDVPLLIINLKDEADIDSDTHKLTVSQYELVLISGTNSAHIPEHGAKAHVLIKNAH